MKGMIIMKKNEKIKNGITELVFILDRSGSMSGLELDTIGGFNSMIDTQQEVEGKAYVSAVLFDDRSEVLYDRVDLGSIRKMTRDDYRVRGCTALYDALGFAVKHIANIHKYARPEDVPEHTMFVITTDGMENASRYFTQSEVKRLIEKEQKKYGWEFIFIGANIDAVTAAKDVGIREERACNYEATSVGTRKIFRAMNAPMMAMRGGKAITNDWVEEIENTDD